MRLITRSELVHHNDSELAALFREVSQGLAHSEPASPERRNALATLENINRERVARLRPPGPGP